MADSAYHSRSYSLESDTSSYFQLDPSSPGPSRQVAVDGPRLHLDPFFSHLTATKSTTPSPRSPEGATSPTDDHSSTNGTHAGHGRFASHLNGNSLHKVPLKYSPSTKKSAPDLRPARLHLPNGSQRAATHAADHFPRYVSRERGNDVQYTHLLPASCIIPITQSPTSLCMRLRYPSNGQCRQWILSATRIFVDSPPYRPLLFPRQFRSLFSLSSTLYEGFSSRCPRSTRHCSIIRCMRSTSVCQRYCRRSSGLQARTCRSSSTH